jgi:hypothetical protein
VSKFVGSRGGPTGGEQEGESPVFSGEGASVPPLRGPRGSLRRHEVKDQEAS